MLKNKAVLLAILCTLCVGKVHAENTAVIVYGQNAPQWNKDLGATATRGSCNSSPEDCMKTVTALLNGQHTESFYLNLPTDADKAPNYAAYYSKASLAEPRLVELDLDDFADHFAGWCRSPKFHCDRVLKEIIDNTKSSNPNLKFGVTIYEDDIPSLLGTPEFTPALRKRIETVHLYIHNRADGPKFEKYLNQLEGKFPNAKIVAGNYPYDRLDYERCHGCSAADARELEKQTLKRRGATHPGGPARGDRILSR